jgi:hypothetical protein
MNLANPHPAVAAFPREVLLAAANLEIRRRIKANSAPYEIEQMRQIAGMLETYPLATTAEGVVKVLVADMQTRKGFRELIEQTDFHTVTRKTWISLLKQAVLKPEAPTSISIPQPDSEDIDL